MKLLQLLELIERLSDQARSAAALARKMREEGRDALTPEELASLKAADDRARDELVAAIEQARAEER